jgi:putative membrane protein
VLWVALAAEPRDRPAWALENVLVVGLLLALWLLRRRVAISLAAWSMTLLFLALHAVGAHYTYTQTPYHQWLDAMPAVSGVLLGGRNNYDRFVHFAGGLLLTSLVRQVAAQLTPMRIGFSHLFALMWIMSASLSYEFLEWAVAVVFGGELGAAYLGTQGDEWDAHKDMALATLGALVSTCASLLWHRSNGLVPATGSRR